MTLIELLIGVTLSLLLIFAVVQVFDWLGTTLTNERAMIELSGQLRSTAQRLQEDLDHVTCRPVTSWVDSAHAKGYFQYQEGPETDSYDNVYDATSDSWNFTQRVTSGALRVTGDEDDLLAFTVYSETPFVGRIVDPVTGGSYSIESTRAEVVWWVAAVDVNLNDRADNDEPRVLLRRQFLLRPDLAVAASSLHPQSALTQGLKVMVLNTPETDGMFVSEVSIGAKTINHLGQEDWLLNDLGTVAWPVNRIGFYTDADNRKLFPNLLRLATNDGFPHNITVDGETFRVPTLEQYGRFVVLSDVLACDVRAYDPTAPVVVLDNAMDAFAVTPGDPGYPLDATGITTAANTGNASRLVGRGAYVDLNYLHDNVVMASRVSLFSGGPNFRQNSGTPYFSTLRDGMLTSTVPSVATYTTWPLDYERDGIDQDSDGLFDEGMNGMDDDDLNGVDDVGERETMPPYPFPLRGIEVRLRMDDFSTRQVRQASVVGDFQTD